MGGGGAVGETVPAARRRPSRRRHRPVRRVTQQLRPACHKRRLQPPLTPDRCGAGGGVDVKWHQGGPAIEIAALPFVDVQRPVQVREPVRQRRRQVPRAAVLACGVGGGDEPHPLTEVQIPDPMLLHHPHQRVLRRRRRGVDLIKEHQRHPVMRGDLTSPLRRQITHRRAVTHRQTTEIGRVVQRRDHRHHRPARLGRIPLNSRGFAGAGISPQQHRHPRPQQHLQRRQRVALGHRHRINHHHLYAPPSCSNSTPQPPAPQTAARFCLRRGGA